MLVWHYISKNISNTSTDTQGNLVSRRWILAYGIISFSPQDKGNIEKLNKFAIQTFITAGNGLNIYFCLPK